MRDKIVIAVMFGMLVGMVLAPMASQISVDYLSPRDFAMRPGLWLKLISRNQATISFGSALGYQLCRQRLRPRDIDELDLGTWRLAAIGSETINPATMSDFASALAPAGFQESALVAGYGMAECSLAVSFSIPGNGLVIDEVDPDSVVDHCRGQTGSARRQKPCTYR